MPKRKSTPKQPDYYDYFPPSQPIKAKDGIQSRSQRGAFASNWWAKRWLSVLESYGIGSRLQRGRSYARSGQVLKIEVQAGLVEARVQGSNPKPYKVEIEVAKIADADWERVLDAISEQAIFAAQLLDSTMPQAIETAFETARVSLFPTSIDDIVTECSCPDFANPCKHIAAVYYLLGEQFDHDPFLIFSLRGRTQAQIIEALRKRRATALPVDDSPDANLIVDAAGPALDADVAGFWGSDLQDWTAPHIAAPDVDAAVLHRLESPPGDIRKSLETIYRAMTAHVQAKVFSSSDTETA